MHYENYKKTLHKIADVNYTSAILQWDQEVYMPAKGAAGRAQQLATLAGIAHELGTSEKLEEILQELQANAKLSPLEKKNVLLSAKDYNQRKKYSTDFVKEMNLCISESYQAWSEAKQKNNFGIFAPKLEKLVELKRTECELLGYKDHPYDALIDLYEPGTTTADIDTLFTGVRESLVAYVKQLAQQPKTNTSFLHGSFNKDKQWGFGIDLLKQMGYDFEAGRQDISSHPFTTNFGANDVRVTTRISENYLSEMIWSCIHEGGHALYEQGLPDEQYGLPCGEYVSLGIHESQSRLWENNVGRSLGYWKKNYSALQQLFPEALQTVTLAEFYAAINSVEPSLIRTNADELTYHFHIMIRFEIEKALIGKSIEVRDLPAVWNQKYKEYLNIDVPSDAKGVLQDIHWSHGSFGYFPTYSLGSFYAAQFFAAAQKQLPQLNQEIEQGNYKNLLLWLRENIHRHGRFYEAKELCKNITGEPLNFNHFMNYATKKYSAIYQLKTSV